jgi:hypothetical protein
MKMQKSNFPLVMKTVTAVTALATAGLAILYRFYPAGWILSVAITTGTTFYHFAMRLLVGTIVPHCVKCPTKRRWFQSKGFEAGLYKKLNVKQWKDHMPTYDPASFSLRENSLEQVVHNSCVSEAVHEVIILFSFIPILFTLLWGALPVFLITSILAALFDSCFVMMQRYNRPRLLRIISKKEA